MTLVVLNGPTIDPGQALSNPLDCTAGQLVRITVPAAWEGTHITLQISTDGALYNDAFDVLGREIIIATVPGTAIIFNVEFSRAAAFVKFRSGTRERPVPQANIQTFAVTLDVPDAP